MKASEFCNSCALSAVIPDLSDSANEQAWRRIEAAKRRLLYTLYSLGLPVLVAQACPKAGWNSISSRAAKMSLS